LFVLSLLWSELRANNDEVVIKIMRSRMRKDIRGKTKENDSNKLLIDDISGDKALSFWSRIAARHVHQPRIVIL
jgi:hypothetical protein